MFLWRGGCTHPTPATSRSPRRQAPTIPIGDTLFGWERLLLRKAHSIGEARGTLIPIIMMAHIASLSTHSVAPHRPMGIRHMSVELPPLAGHGLHGIGHDREGKPGEQRKEWRLSRFNQWLPGREAHPDVVEGSTDVHHDIADALFPEADPVFDNATALHTAVDMLDSEPSTVQGLVGPLRLPRQLLAAGASWSA